jgi:hypothetical protein
MVPGGACQSVKREVQDDGRIRFWGIISESGGRALRVATLADGETVHNAFPDRDFVPPVGPVDTNLE